MMEVHWCDSVFGEIFCICFMGIILLVVCFIIYTMLKYKMLKLYLDHEAQMKNDDWQRKKEWEEAIVKKSDDPESLKGKLSEKEKELKAKETEISNLKDQLKKAIQLDIERMALLVHSSSNGREYWTPEKTAKLVEQVKSTHDAIKKYLDMES